VKKGSGLNRDTALAAAAAYQSLYCDDEEGDHIQATYQVRLQLAGKRLQLAGRVLQEDASRKRLA
jgi:hypothetical protein